jgi:hypothetical protein
MDTGLVWFGIVDNGVLVLAMVAGVSLDRVWMPARWRSPALSAICAGAIGNTLSDALAAVPMGWRAVVAVAAGCIMGPFLAGVVVGAWRGYGRMLTYGFGADGRHRVATARDASEG